MSLRTSPPFMRRQLGRTLRRLREQAGIAVPQACAELEFSTSKLSRIENGESCPDIHALKSMLDLYVVPADRWAPIIDLRLAARKKGWWQAYGLEAMGYTALETAASVVRNFELEYIPGLLQTEEYARAVMRKSLLRRTEKQFEGDVAVRMIRQQRLFEADEPLELAAIIDQGALGRMIGGTPVMKAQLEHLQAVAVLPQVTLQVVPTEIDSHLGMAGAFTVLSFATAEELDVAYIEHVAGSLRLEKGDQVRACRLTFEELRTEALNPADSLRLIERLTGMT